MLLSRSLLSILLKMKNEKAKKGEKKRFGAVSQHSNPLVHFWHFESIKAPFSIREVPK